MVIKNKIYKYVRSSMKYDWTILAAQLFPGLHGVGLARPRASYVPSVFVVAEPRQIFCSLRSQNKHAKAIFLLMNFSFCRQSNTPVAPS
jgi:hypothetical protein